MSVFLFTETVEEAEDKIKLLKLKPRRKSCLYTEDSDFTPEEKAKLIQEKYRQNQTSSVKRIMLNVPSIDTDESSIDSEWESSQLKKLSAPKSKAVERAANKTGTVKKKRGKKNKKRNNLNEDSSISSSESNIINNNVT